MPPPVIPPLLTAPPLLRIINPRAWNLSWVVLSLKKLFGLMRLFVSAAGIALMSLAIPSSSSPIWGAPVRFARTAIVLRGFKRPLKPVPWIAFTGLLLMTSRVYKRSSTLRSFYRLGCPHLLARDEFFLASPKTELRWHHRLPWLCHHDASDAQS